MVETEFADVATLIRQKDLPAGWSVTMEYETSVKIRSPESRPEEIIISDWSEDDEPEYVVMPMGQSSLSGASSESINEYADSFKNIENAVAYAVENVVPILESGSY